MEPPGLVASGATPLRGGAASAWETLLHSCEHELSLDQLTAQTTRLTDDAWSEPESAPIRVMQIASILRFAWKANASCGSHPLDIEAFLYPGERRTYFSATTLDTLSVDQAELGFSTRQKHGWRIGGVQR
jgi:hypothetical protein